MRKSIYELIDAGKKNFTPHILIDIAGDHIAASVLSQILYWFRPDKNGKSKLGIERDGVAWLAKSSRELAEEVHSNNQQIDRAVQRLKKRGFIEVRKYKFMNSMTNHYRPLFENIEKAAEAVTNKPKAENSEKTPPAAVPPVVGLDPVQTASKSRRRRNRINENPFKPPEVSEVAEFFNKPEMRERFSWDPNFTPENEAERLVNYYGSIGWIHSNGKIVTDWSVCANAWPDTGKKIFDQIQENRASYIARCGKEPKFPEKEMWLIAADQVKHRDWLLPTSCRQ